MLPFSAKNGKITLLPSLNSVSYENETWEGGLYTEKCAARNSAFCICMKEMGRGDMSLNVLFIDSAENNTMFHTAMSFPANDKVNVLATSRGASWDRKEGNFSVIPFKETVDAYCYSARVQKKLDGIFLDACGQAPRLLGDICGIVKGQDCVSSFKRFYKVGGVFGITWQNTRYYCTRKNVRTQSQHVQDCVLGVNG